MNRWLRVFAPAVALAVVLVTAFAALGGGRVSAGQPQVAEQPAADLIAAQAAKPAVAVAAQPPHADGRAEDEPRHRRRRAAG